jgi:uncharacterized protein
MVSWMKLSSGLIAVAMWAGQACSHPAQLNESRFGIHEEQVQFRNGDVTLHGSLLLPASCGRHPAVVIFHGSGPEGRNMTMARWFAGQGVAALTYDKRGVGESAGDFRQVAFMDLCGDGLAGIDLLEKRADIQANHVGVWGLSQGGWLGPLAASRSKQVSFVIAVSGPGVTPGEQMIFLYGRQLQANGFTGAQVEEASALRRQIWNFLATGEGYQAAKAALDSARSKPWYASLAGQGDGLFALPASKILQYPPQRSRVWFNAEMKYDPTLALRGLTVPALFLFGDNDDLVPVGRSVEIIRSTLTHSGHRDFTIRVFPGADHGIYVTLPDGTMQLAPGYLDAMRDWLHQRLS